MRSAVMCGCVVALCAVSGAQGAFTGLSVSHAGTVGGRDVYHVYANFSASTDMLLNALKHQVVAGDMSGVCHNDIGGGSWNSSFTALPGQVSNDSFVTISGLSGSASSTTLDQSFGSGTGQAIPPGAGWFNSTPTSAILAGKDLRVMIMQVAMAPGAKGYSASLAVGYRESRDSTTPLFGNGVYTIPAPGAMGLLAAAGVASRRRHGRQPK